MGEKGLVSDTNQIWFNKKKGMPLVGGLCHITDFDQHNVSNVVQTLGLATFNGRNVLNDNGFRNVTVLMTSNDLSICIKYQNYVNHVARRMQQENTFATACSPQKNVPLVGGLCHITDFDQVWSKKMCPS
jgi:hypothetical protein